MTSETEDKGGDEKVKGGRWAGIGCIVLGIISIIWGVGIPGVIGVGYILEGEPWDTWFTYLVTVLFMVGLGILSIVLGLDERRRRREPR